jgi:5-formyltetrahydrofolate cyclo-ligase
LNHTVQGHGSGTAFAEGAFPFQIPDHPRLRLSTDFEKPELRRALRARRHALSPQLRERAADALAANAAALRVWQVARRIGFYLSNDSEIDPMPLMARAQSRGKCCYLPVLSRISGDRLWFAPLQHDTPMRANRFGIPEPRVLPRELVRAAALDLILMPLVGFDADGNRLGMGGGFYDRSLDFLRGRRFWRKPHLVGLAYDFQRVDALPVNDWDVPLMSIVTDRHTYITAQP